MLRRQCSLLLLTLIFTWVCPSPSDAGNLFVASLATDSVKNYNGANGNYLGDFVSSGSGGLNVPVGMAFGGDGNLYVASRDVNEVGSILRYNGTSGSFIDVFASGGGLLQPNFLAFQVPEPNSLRMAIMVTALNTGVLVRRGRRR